MNVAITHVQEVLKWDGDKNNGALSITASAKETERAISARVESRRRNNRIRDAPFPHRRVRFSLHDFYY